MGKTTPVSMFATPPRPWREEERALVECLAAFFSDEAVKAPEPDFRERIGALSLSHSVIHFLQGNKAIREIMKDQLSPNLQASQLGCSQAHEEFKSFITLMENERIPFLPFEGHREYLAASGAENTDSIFPVNNDHGIIGILVHQKHEQRAEKLRQKNGLGRILIYHPSEFEKGLAPSFFRKLHERADSVPFDNSELKTLSVPDAFLMISIIGEKRFWSSLSMVCDMAVMMKHNRDRLEKLLHYTASHGALIRAHSACMLANRLFLRDRLLFTDADDDVRYLARTWRKNLFHLPQQTEIDYHYLHLVSCDDFTRKCEMLTDWFLRRVGLRK